MSYDKPGITDEMITEYSSAAALNKKPGVDVPRSYENNDNGITLEQFTQAHKSKFEKIGEGVRSGDLTQALLALNELNRISQDNIGGFNRQDFAKFDRDLIVRDKKDGSPTGVVIRIQFDKDMRGPMFSLVGETARARGALDIAKDEDLTESQREWKENGNTFLTEQETGSFDIKDMISNHKETFSALGDALRRGNIDLAVELYNVVRRFASNVQQKHISDTDFPGYVSFGKNEQGEEYRINFDIYPRQDSKIESIRAGANIALLGKLSEAMRL